MLHIEQVYYHALGTTQDKDVRVFADPDHPQWLFGAEVCIALIYPSNDENEFIFQISTIFDCCMFVPFVHR